METYAHAADVSHERLRETVIDVQEQMRISPAEWRTSVRISLSAVCVCRAIIR